MGVYIKGNPSEGTYRLTYQETSDKGMVAVLERNDIAFIGQIVKAPHGRLIDADRLHDALKTKQMWVVRCGDKNNEGYTYDQVHFGIDEAPTVIEAEVE